MPSPSMKSAFRFCSSVHLAQHNVHAAEDDDDVRHGPAQAHVFQHGQVDEARRSYAIPIRVRRAVADEIKSQLALRPLETWNLSWLVA